MPRSDRTCGGEVANRRRPLWLLPEAAERFRDRLGAGDRTANAIAAAAAATAGADDATRATEPIVASAVLACIDRDEKRGAAACLAWMALARADAAAGNLRRADVALAGAAVADAVAGLPPLSLQSALRDRLRDVARSFREPDLKHGDPHVVTNNHWGVSHAGAAIAAMASFDGTPASADLVEWARGRVRAYLLLHGDAGLYHEGIGYQLYPASFWLPFVLASLHFDGTDEFARCPTLREAAVSLYSLTRPSHAAANGRGFVLSWNDAGREWCDSGAAVLLAALAPEPQRGGLRSLFDRLNGTDGDGRFGPRFAGLFFAMAAYPFEAAQADPDAVLPRWVVDSRQGYVFSRSRYRDGNDAILGGYGRCSHPGGHAHDDAGSLRLSALGHDWIMGGGQNRGSAEWQSIVTPADGGRPSKPIACGSLAWAAPAADGGVFAFDLRRPSQAYAERWVSVRFADRDGTGTTDLAVLDVIDDHTARDWHWNLSFEAELSFQPHPDCAGFDLIAADGSRLSSRFVGQRPAALELLRMPDSNRTFQAGNRETYPGLPYVRAAFANRPHVAIYWAARIHRGLPSDIRLADPHVADLLIDGHPWRRPFGSGVATTFSPLRGGTPSRHPEGVKA